MDQTSPDGTQGQPEQSPFFTKKRSRYILVVTIGLLVVIVAVIVLAVLLTRKTNECGAGDKDVQGDKAEDGTFFISFTSFESFGIVKNALRLAVSYKAPKVHTTDWLIRYKSSDIYRTVGAVRSHKDDENAFSTEVTVQDFSDVYQVQLILHTAAVYALIDFNYTFLKTKGSTNIPAWRNEIICIEDNVVATTDKNLTIHVTLKLEPEFQRMMTQSSKQLTEFIVMEILFVNKTDEPPVLYNVFHDFPENIMTADITNINENLVDLSVSISSDHVQYGGLFIVGIPENVTADYISNIQHGVLVNVLSPVSKDVVPENTIGVLFPFNNQTYIFSKRHTLVCVAMGNPLPEVTMYKEGNNSKSMNLKSEQETLIKDDYLHMVGYTVETSDRNNQGRYLCMARNDYSVTQTAIEVIFAEFPVISVNETGVVENTTEKITIKCQASGKPKPDIQLNLFVSGGPDLIKTGLYQVNQSVTDMDTSVVTLTRSPPNPVIHTVYCRAFQNYAYQDSVKLQLFPYNEANGIDWVLYHRMENLSG